MVIILLAIKEKLLLWTKTKMIDITLKQILIPCLVVYI